MVRKWIAGLALAALWSGAAHAADWHNVGGNSRTMTYVDADSIIRKGEKSDVWTWSVYAKPINEETYSVRIKSEYDCAAGYFRTIEYVYFGDKLKYLRTEPSETLNDRKYPVPGSINETIMEFVCKRSGGVKTPNPLTHAAAEFAKY